MSSLYIVLLGLLLVFLLYGDMRARQNTPLEPEKAAVLKYEKWPTWKTIEPPDTRIRVLWVDQDYVPWVNAGSEICTHTINKFLMTKPYKWDVWVATPGYPGKKTFENIRCFDLNDTSTLLEVLKSTTILQSHSYAYRNNLMYISRRTGIPFVGWVHSDNYVTSVNRDTASWNDPRIKGWQWTAFNSKSLKNKVGVDVPNSEIFIPVVDYREYGIDKAQQKRQYVLLSNVNSNKGGHLLIQLAKACPDIEFMGVIGGYRKQIIDKTLPNLTYIPHTNRIKDIYSKAWVVLMPSWQETWGRTAVEAMSSGIPVIVSPTPGLRECCGDAAVYIDRNNLEGWITTLRKLKEDSEFYNKRCKLAMERARTLDPKPVLESIEDWLENRVVPSGKRGQELTAFEKNLLFR